MKRFILGTLMVLIAMMDIGYVRPGLAQTDNDFLPVPISGASGQSVRTNVTFALWAWTAPAAAPVVFDNAGTDFATLLGIYDDDDTLITSNFDLENLTLADEVRFTAQQGHVYQIIVFRFDGSSEPGSIVLNWRAASVGPACDPSLVCGTALTCVDGQLYRSPEPMIIPLIQDNLPSRRFAGHCGHAAV